MMSVVYKFYYIEKEIKDITCIYIYNSKDINLNFLAFILSDFLSLVLPLHCWQHKMYLV